MVADTGTTAATRDLITDFTKGADHVSLSGIDADAIAGGDQAFSFVGFKAFSGKAGELRETFSDGNTIVAGDINGDSVADFRIEFTGHLTFGASDFIL
jgi:hypothetical protein